MRRLLRLFVGFRHLEDSNRGLLEERSMLLRSTASNEAEIVNLYKNERALKDKIRVLETELDEARGGYRNEQQARILAEDRLNSAIQDRDKLWDLVQESLRGERFALQTQVNHANQKTGGGIVYEEAHFLPPNVLPKPQEGGPIGRRGRSTLSQAESEMTAIAVEEYAKLRNPQSR